MWHESGVSLPLAGPALSSAADRVFSMPRSSLPSLFRMYLAEDTFFPIVGAVLECKQAGAVLANATGSPPRVFVEHRFGFGQVFGSRDDNFDASVVQVLKTRAALIADKSRLYGPPTSILAQTGQLRGSVSLRQRLIIQRIRGDRLRRSSRTSLVGVRFSPAAKGSVRLLEEQFGVVRRFWPTDQDFCLHALAEVAWVHGRPVGVCYAAAVSGGRAEVDVVVAHEYRGRGIATELVKRFIESCWIRGIDPLWDCFANNSASMALALSLGFEPQGDPYPMLTIPQAREA